jgi:hypothetical protein
MALSADAYTSTPLGYATPEQTAAAQAFADLLSKNATSNQLIRSPWQGVANMTQAVMSGLDQRWAAQAAQKARDTAAAQRQNASNYGNAAPPSNPGYAPAPAAAPAATPAPAAAPAPAGNYWNPAYGSPSAATGVGAQPWGILAPPPVSNAYTGGT